jgi:nicotinate phosphoribosyltransferase
MPIHSILDTDLYKLTMQQAVFAHFPIEPAVYRFTNRTQSDLFSTTCVDKFRRSVNDMENLSLTPAERTWLEKTCPYLKPPYIVYLSTFRFKPQTQVHIVFHPVPQKDLPESLKGTEEEYGTLEIWTEGTWLETILWEVPLMASLCEAYFETVDTDWVYDGQKELAYQKTKTMLQASCVLSEFGTRRRRSFKTHDLVVEGVMAASRDYIKEAEEGKIEGGGKVVGTSNVRPIFSIVLDIGFNLGAGVSGDEARCDAVRYDCAVRSSFSPTHILRSRSRSNLI